jgi:hypothetical protein
MGWTKKSYDAVHDWIDASKRDKIRKILFADGLGKVVERLDTAKNLGEWYTITREAAKAVGSHVVESVANHAAQQLQTVSASVLGSMTSAKKARSSRTNGLKGGKPKHLRGGRPKGSKDKRPRKGER